MSMIYVRRMKSPESNPRWVVHLDSQDIPTLGYATCSKELEIPQQIAATRAIQITEDDWQKFVSKMDDVTRGNLHQYEVFKAGDYDGI